MKVCSKSLHLRSNNCGDNGQCSSLGRSFSHCLIFLVLHYTRVGSLEHCRLSKFFRTYFFSFLTLSRVSFSLISSIMCFKNEINKLILLDGEISSISEAVS